MWPDLRPSLGAMGYHRLALLFVCIAALFLASEGARQHEEFAATTFYKPGENETVVKPEETETVQDRYPNGYPGTKELYAPKETETVQDRYPNGYPGTKELYAPVTSGKFVQNETVSTTTTQETTTTQPPGGRYEHGYYNESGWDTPSETETIPVVKSYKGTYTTVEKDAAGIYDRYPNGYPTKRTPSYTGPSLGLAETLDDLHRYEQGYYGKANQYLKKTNEQPSYFTSKTEEPKSTYNPLDRYPGGYYANANKQNVQQRPDYQTYSTKPNAQFTSSYTGNFNTMPYPATGVPFSPTGAGCRTAYWAQDVALWPQFFTAQSTLADAFGTKAGEVFGLITILQSLLKYDQLPYSDLARTGSTALLNSYERGGYPLSHMKVIAKFNDALISKEAASAQALEFEKYNVDSISQGNACGS